MRIGIFGGSFNPPHKMHESIAKQLIEKDFIDKIKDDEELIKRSSYETYNTINLDVLNKYRGIL